MQKGKRIVFCPFDKDCKEFNKIRPGAGTDKCHNCKKKEAALEALSPPFKKTSGDIRVLMQGFSSKGARKAWLVIKTLPWRSRMIWIEFRLLDCLQQEIAECHGISQPAVSQIIKRADEMIKERMK